MTGSIFIISIQFFGTGLGPLLAGMLSDWFTPSYGVYAIQQALLSLIFLKVVAFAFFMIAARYVDNDLEVAES